MCFYLLLDSMRTQLAVYYAHGSCEVEAVTLAEGRW